MQNTFPGIQTLRRYRRNMSRGAGMDQVFVGSSARLMRVGIDSTTKQNCHEKPNLRRALPKLSPVIIKSTILARQDGSKSTARASVFGQYENFLDHAAWRVLVQE